MLSVENSEGFIIDRLKESYNNKYKSTTTSKNLRRIKDFHPTNCRTLIGKGICPESCVETAYSYEEEELIDYPTPLSLYLMPTRIKTHVNKNNLFERIKGIKNLLNTYWKLKKYHRDENALFFNQYEYEYFEKHLNANLECISRTISTRNYPFVGYSKIFVPKKINNNQMEYRIMSYSSIYDQIIIQGTFNVIADIFEDDFQNCSYGYRCNLENKENDRIFEDWREKYPVFRDYIITQLRNPNNRYYISGDIEKYFDNIDQSILLQQIRKYIRDTEVLALLDQIISLYEYETNKKKGLPQGPAYSGILANLYLNDFDNEIKKISAGYARYVDDIFIFFKTKDEAEQGLQKINELLEQLGLSLSKD